MLTKQSKYSSFDRHINDDSQNSYNDDCSRQEADHLPPTLDLHETGNSLLHSHAHGQSQTCYSMKHVHHSPGISQRSQAPSGPAPHCHGHFQHWFQ